jgi:hypothetical protein
MPLTQCSSAKNCPLYCPCISSCTLARYTAPNINVSNARLLAFFDQRFLVCAQERCRAMLQATEVVKLEPDRIHHHCRCATSNKRHCIDQNKVAATHPTCKFPACDTRDQCREERSGNSHLRVAHLHPHLGYLIPRLCHGATCESLFVETEFCLNLNASHSHFV